MSDTDVGRGAADLVPMTAEEARRSVTRIKDALEDARASLLELYERQGWRSLGYESWRACVQAEFRQSQAYLYRQLEAAQTQRAISPIGETPIPESHLRELAPLARTDPETARDVYREAVETAPNGRITAAHVAGVRVVVTQRTTEAAIPLPQARPVVTKGVTPGDVAWAKRHWPVEAAEELDHASDRDALWRALAAVRSLQQHCRGPLSQWDADHIRDELARMESLIEATRRDLLRANPQREAGE